MSKALVYKKKKKRIYIYIILIWMALIFLGVIIWNHNNKQYLYLKEKEQLYNMSEYLTKVDMTVTQNQRDLSEVSLFNEKTEKCVQEFSDELQKLKKAFYQTYTALDNYTANTGKPISVTSADRKEIILQIQSLQKEIVNISNEIQSADESRYTDIADKLVNLQNTCRLTKASMEKYYNSISTMITEYKSDNQSDNKDMLNVLIKSNEDLKNIIAECFGKMQLQLNEDILSLYNKLEEIHEQITNASESVSYLLGLMEERADNMQEEIEVTFQSVMKFAELIQTDFNNAHMEVQALILSLQETESANHEETLNVLSVMEKNMQDNSVQSLNQVTDSLHDIQQKFNSSVTDMRTELSQELTLLTTEIQNSHMQSNNIFTEKIDELKNAIDNQFSSLNSTVYDLDGELRKYIQDIVSDKIDRLQESVNNSKMELEQKLEQVFQFVSNGKKILASALLTKGVSVSEDASFKEIQQAILNIPQQIVIGVEKIPGEIIYQYHYHTDHKGNHPRTDQMDEKGGCYTIPVYHIHSGDSKGGGGCYTVPINHIHAEECYNVKRTVRTVTSKWFTGQGTGHACCKSGYGQNWAKCIYREDIYISGELISSTDKEEELGYCCGLCFDWKADKKACDETEKIVTCDITEGIVGYEPGCGKTAHTIIGYKPGCSLGDGQITGASITYTKDALLQPAFHAMENEYPDETETIMNQEDIETEASSETGMPLEEGGNTPVQMKNNL